MNKLKLWAEDDLPVTKLHRFGTEQLSDAEVLSIIINNGSKQRNALDISKELLFLAKNNLSEIGKLSAHQIQSIKGIGKQKAATILASIELGRRRSISQSITKKSVTSSMDIAAMLKSMLKDSAIEVFGVIFMKSANRVNHFEIISRGGVTGTIADPRIILQKALEVQAVNLILVHNHPSGNLKPSKSDEELTQKIKNAASYFDIRVIDHIIISEEGYYSFADEGIL